MSNTVNGNPKSLGAGVLTSILGRNSEVKGAATICEKESRRLRGVKSPGKVPKFYKTIRGEEQGEK